MGRSAIPAEYSVTPPVPFQTVEAPRWVFRGRSADAVAFRFRQNRRRPRRPQRVVRVGDAAVQYHGLDGAPDGMRFNQAGTGRSGAAIATGLYPESGWLAAPTGHRRAGGQKRPAGGGHGADGDLRSRFSRLFLWVPAGRRFDALGDLGQWRAAGRNVLEQFDLMSEETDLRRAVAPYQDSSAARST
jgi:hypothetical protein